MSRAILKMALVTVLGREPSEDELTDFLRKMAQLAKEANVDRVYIPQREPESAELVARVIEARKQKKTIRQIAKTEGVSKDRVHRILSQNSAYFVDAEAA